jgi:hypothetical protein
MFSSRNSPEFQALPTRTIRVFVSSTFDDLKEERNALQERVFPQKYAPRRLPPMQLTLPLPA